MSINKVILMGNLIRDVTLRTAGASTVASFTIAVNRFYTTKEGDKKEDVTFVDCTAFGRTADNIGRFFSKGKRILIDGVLRTDSWEDKKDGSKRSKLVVIVENFHFTESHSSGQSRPAQPQAQTRHSPEQNPGFDDDSLPF